MSRKLTITIDVTVPEDFYRINESTILDDVTNAVDNKLNTLLVLYYSRLQGAGMSVVTIKESKSL